MSKNNKAHIKKRIFDIIQIGNKEDFPSRAFDIFIVITILLNVLMMFCDTFEQFSPFFKIFKIIEIVTIGIFCVEYILRIWTSDYLYPEKTKKGAALKFLVSYDGIIDLLTILPFFYLSGFVVFRMLRVVRIFHLFRINAQYDSFHVITAVLSDKKNQILSSLFIIFVLMLGSSLGMYSVEHEAQPEVFKNAFSGLWWSMSTMLTVGYGDIYPITTLGQIMAILIAFLGVGAVAIPTGIISAGFVEQYSKTRHADQTYYDIDDIGELYIGEENPFIGRHIGDIQDEYKMHILVIIRGNLTIIATNSALVEEGDVLVIRSKQIKKGQKRK